MGIKHNFVSQKADKADDSLVRPSDWNDEHVVDGNVDLGDYDLITTGQVVNRNIQASLSCGVHEGMQVSINADPTKIDIAAGSYTIVDCWSDPQVPVEYNVTYAGATGITVDNLATANFTYILIDKDQTIIQLTSAPTDSQHRNTVTLAQLGHTNRTSVVSVNPQVEVFAAPIEQLRDYWNFFAISSKGNIISANGANLNINKSIGYLFAPGANYYTDSSAPNVVEIAAAEPATFRRRTQTGAGANGATTLDVGNYDVSGTITAIVGTKYTNQRVYLFPNGNIIVQYGQTLYTNMANAIAAIPNESYVVYSNIEGNAAFIGVITVRSTATDLSSSSQATFTRVDTTTGFPSGSSGTSTTTLQQAYENSNANPEIETTSTGGAVTLRSYSGGDATNVLEVQNNAGTVNCYITGEGNMSISGDISGNPDLASATIATGKRIAPMEAIPLDGFFAFWDDGQGRFLTTAPLSWDGIEIAVGANLVADSLESTGNIVAPNVTYTYVSVDNAVPKANGTGGQLQNSGVVIDDSNNVSGIVNITMTGDIAGDPDLANATIATGKRIAPMEAIPLDGFFSFWDDGQGRFLTTAPLSWDGIEVSVGANLVANTLESTGSLVAPNVIYTYVSTDNTVPRANGTGGQLQSSNVTIDDSDNLVVPGYAYATYLAVGTAYTGAADIMQEANLNDGVTVYYQLAPSSGSAKFQIKSVTGTGFIPGIICQGHDSNDSSLFIQAQTTVANDTGTTPLYIFDGRQDDNTALVTRPLARFSNLGVNKFQIENDGTVTTGIWNATTMAVGYGGTGQTTYTNGQLLIGNTTGNTLTKATLTGTSNQVTVTNGAGSITLSTPQSIATSSAVQFASMKLNHSATSNGVLDVDASTGTVRAIRMRGAPSTSAQIYGTGANYGLNIDVGTSTSSYYAGIFVSGAGTVLNARADGAVLMPTLGTSTGTDLVIDGSGIIYKKSSSKRYKDNIEYIELDSDFLYKLKPVSFNYKGFEAKQVGYIAEDVAEIEPQLVNYDDENKPTSIDYSKTVVYLVEEIKRLNERIERLENGIKV